MVGCDKMVDVHDLITVGILHRHKLFAEGLRQLIYSHPSLQVIAEGTSKDELAFIIKKCTPNILLLDANLVEKEDLEKAKDLLQNAPNTNIILLSNRSFDTEYMMTALECGIHGFLLKDLSCEMLTEVIIAVHKGEFWLHPQACGCLVEAFQDLKTKFDKNESGLVRSERPENLLSEREWEVLELIAHGESNKLIAKHLGITEPTVKAHVSHIIKKFHVDDRMNAALLAIKNGWVDIDVQESHADSKGKASATSR